MRPDPDVLLQRQLDISEPDIAEVDIDYDRRVIYVNVNGLTVVRISQADVIQLKTKGKKLVKVPS